MLRKALLEVKDGELLDADRAVVLCQRAGIPVTPNEARSAVAGVARASGGPRPRHALGDRDWVAPADLLKAARHGR